MDADGTLILPLAASNPAKGPNFNPHDTAKETRMTTNFNVIRTLLNKQDACDYLGIGEKQLNKNYGDLAKTTGGQGNMYYIKDLDQRVRELNDPNRKNQ